MLIHIYQTAWCHKPKDHNLKWFKQGKITDSYTQVLLQLRTYSKKYEPACTSQYAAVNRNLNDTHDSVFHTLLHANMCYSMKARGYSYAYTYNEMTSHRTNIYKV